MQICMIIGTAVFLKNATDNILTGRISLWAVQNVVVLVALQFESAPLMLSLCRQTLYCL